MAATEVKTAATPIGTVGAAVVPTSGTSHTSVVDDVWSVDGLKIPTGKAVIRYLQSKNGSSDVGTEVGSEASPDELLGVKPQELVIAEEKRFRGDFKSLVRRLVLDAIDGAVTHHVAEIYLNDGPLEDRHYTNRKYSELWPQSDEDSGKPMVSGGTTTTDWREVVDEFHRLGGYGVEIDGRGDQRQVKLVLPWL